MDTSYLPATVDAAYLIEQVTNQTALHRRRVKNISTLTTFILDVLGDNPTKAFSLSLINSLVETYVRYKDHYPTRVILDSLVTTKVVKQYRGDRFQIAEAAPAQAPSTTPTRDPNGRIQGLETTLQNVEKERDSFQSKLVEACLVIAKKTEEKNELARQLENKPKDRIVAVQLMQGKKKAVKFEDLFHEQFENVLNLAQARMNIFLYGPTGCGKSHICEQVAKAMDLPFYFVSCTAGMSEGILGGRLLPTGEAGKFEYTISEFIKAYENGGVFLLDEIDAADPNVLLLVNAALANGKVAVPNRPEKPYAVRHEDFICVAAANTVGTGADRLYSGRNKLDAATLDRFQIGKIMMGYSDDVEKQLCPDDELRSTLTLYREAINENRLERAMSTRFMRDAFKMKNDFNWSQEQIDTAFFSGWREDEVNKVQSFVASKNR